MEAALIVAFGAACLVGGYLLATHIHQVASAASRAVTVPGSAIDALNAKVDGLGTKVDTASTKLAEHVTDAVSSLAPKP